MAAVHGKCPLCGAAIKVNDEKETGFCSQCGKQIDIKQSISLAHESEDKTQTQSEQQGQRRTAPLSAGRTGSAKQKRRLCFQRRT